MKKIFMYGIGSIVVASAPIVSVVSCGTNSQQNEKTKVGLSAVSNGFAMHLQYKVPRTNTVGIYFKTGKVGEVVTQVTSQNTILFRIKSDFSKVNPLIQMNIDNAGYKDLSHYKASITGIKVMRITKLTKLFTLNITGECIYVVNASQIKTPDLLVNAFRTLKLFTKKQIDNSLNANNVPFKVGTITSTTSTITNLTLTDK